MVLNDDGIHLIAPRGVHMRCGSTSLVLGPTGTGNQIKHHNLTFFSAAVPNSPVAASPDAPPPEIAKAQIGYFALRSNGMAGELPDIEPPDLDPKKQDYSADRDVAGAKMRSKIELEKDGVSAASEESLFKDMGVLITGNIFEVQGGELVVLSQKGVNLQQSGPDGKVNSATRLLSDDEQELFKTLYAKQKALTDALRAFKKAEFEYEQSVKEQKQASTDYDKAFAEVSKLTNVYQGFKQKMEEHDRKIAEHEKKKAKAAQAISEGKKREDDTSDPDIDFQMAKEAIEDEQRLRSNTEKEMKAVGEKFDKAYDTYNRAKEKLEKAEKKSSEAKKKLEAARRTHEQLKDELVALKKEINRKTAPRTGSDHEGA
jgi:hypothetical protein